MKELINNWNFNKLTKRVSSSVEGKNISIAEFILGHALLMHIDHKDRNTLNNQKENLRFCTRTQNQANRVDKKNSTGYKGVSIMKDRHKKYKAEIQVNNRRITIGYFYSAKEAGKAYNKAALKYFGEFALLNTIEN